MIDKDISNLSKSELIEKYSKMKEFVILTSIAKNLSLEHILTNSSKQIYDKPLDFVADNDKNIIIKAFKCVIYRNNKNQILMITTDNFEVIG